MSYIRLSSGWNHFVCKEVGNEGGIDGEVLRRWEMVRVAHSGPPR